MGHGALHQSFRRGSAVFPENVLFQRAAVDADADGDPLFAAGPHHFPHLLIGADVARVDADFVGPFLGGPDGGLVVKVDVGHQGQRRIPADASKGPGGLFIGHGEPGHMASGLFQSVKLAEGGFHIGGFGVGHGLNAEGGAAPNGHPPHHDLFCFSFHSLYPAIRRTMSL